MATSDVGSKSRGRRRLAAGALALTLVAGAAGPARAGYCPPEDAAADLRALERYGKRGGDDPHVDELCVEEIQAKPKLAARLIAACDAVLAREPGYWDCLAWSEEAGVKTLGGVDIFAAIAKVRDLDPFAEGRLTVELYLGLGDPRAVAPVLAALRAGYADPRSGKKKFAYLWSAFQNDAVELFTRLGGAPERALLAERIPLTRAPGLRKRMVKAVAAIDKRAAAPASTSPRP